MQVKHEYQISRHPEPRKDDQIYSAETIADVAKLYASLHLTSEEERKDGAFTDVWISRYDDILHYFVDPVKVRITTEVHITHMIKGIP